MLVAAGVSNGGWLAGWEGGDALIKTSSRHPRGVGRCGVLIVVADPNLHRRKHSVKLSTHPEADANKYGKCRKSERGGWIESASTSWW